MAGSLSRALLAPSGADPALPVARSSFREPQDAASESISQGVHTVPARPGGPLASRPLHFIWIADCSGSMASDGRVRALNTAIRETLPHLREVAAGNPNADVLMRVLRFATGASWHVGEATPVDDYRHDDLVAGGVTDLGAALDLVTEGLRVPPMS